MEKMLARNRSVKHEYFILDNYEAGIVLKADEVKSLKKSKCSLKESWVDIKDGEVWLKQCHIANYENAFSALDEKRDRKLLLHRREINQLSEKIKEKGYTLVVDRIYYTNGKIKCNVCLVQGKKLYDKRRCSAERDAKRKIEQALKTR